MRDSELSMLSCVSLSERAQHLPTFTEHAQSNTTDSTANHCSSSPTVFTPKHLLEDKENAPVNYSKAVPSMCLENSACSGHSGNGEELEESLIVFPNKQQGPGGVSQLQMTPRSDTRNLLRQQERQLRALQEQVFSYLILVYLVQYPIIHVLHCILYCKTAHAYMDITIMVEKL